MPATAILLALISIGLWAFLALLASSVSHLPPLFVTGLALFISGLAGILITRCWRVPIRTLLVGVGGIFGYHALYFAALGSAPAVEANLINYLWPLLIVLLSPLVLTGVQLHWHHLAGGLLGLAGVALIVSGGKLEWDLGYWQGYLMASMAAVIWAVYSLLTRRLPPFPSAAVGLFCLVGGLLALLLYLVQQKGPLPSLTARDGLILLLISAGPLGGAFFAWDAALKRGDPRIIGALTYLTPLLSTLLLVWLGKQPFHWSAAAAVGLIVVGALVGSLDLIRPRSTSARF